MAPSIIRDELNHPPEQAPTDYFYSSLFSYSGDFYAITIDFLPNL